eukprot:1998090-Alexandrium_andersonii.AAC.1
MSASLVGSEMCIRDRGRILPLSFQPSRGRELPFSFQSSRGRELLFSFPVSYTHLTLPTICSV